MKDDVVERIARRIRKINGENIDDWKYREPEARAALKAIEDAGLVIVPREPTRAMLAEGADAAKLYNEQGGVLGVERQVWAAMIETATIGE